MAGLIGGMTMPGAAPQPMNYSYTPAPLPFPGAASVPASTVPAAAMGQPMWQPGQPLVPNMPQAMPQAFPQPMMQAPMAAPLQQQVLPQMPSYTPMPMAPQVVETIAPTQQVLQAAPMVETIQQQAMVAPQVMQAPQYVPQMLPQMQYGAPQMLPQVQYGGGLQYGGLQYEVQAAPVIQAAPAVETITSAPTMMMEQFVQQAPITIAPQVTAATYATGPAVMEQMRMSSQVPQMIGGGVTYAPSYIPSQPQVSSYIPAAAPMAYETYTAQPQVASYIPQAQVVETIAAPQMASYIPAASPVVETYANYAAPQVASYIPAPVQQAQVVETFAPSISYAAPQTISSAYAASTLQPQQVSYIPAAPLTAQPVAQAVTAAPMQPILQEGGQSVIVEQVGDWLVCEDALGVFFHHTPTQQSYDNAPPEFMQLVPFGWQPPPLGAFAAAGYAAQPQVASYIPAQQLQTVGLGAPMVETYAPQVYNTGAAVMPQYEQVTYASPAPVVQNVVGGYGAPMFETLAAPAMGTQLPPMMAKVLN